MNRLRHYVIAFAVGAALAWFVALLMGRLAAIAIPREFFAALKGHDIFAFILHTTLLVQFPPAVISFIVGYFLFRSLQAPSLILVAVCATPWLVSVAISGLSYYASADFPPLVKLSLLFSWQSSPGLLGPPLALLLAWTLRVPPGSNFSVQPTAFGGD